MLRCSRGEVVNQGVGILEDMVDQHGVLPTAWLISVDSTPASFLAPA